MRRLWLLALLTACGDEPAAPQPSPPAVEGAGPAVGPAPVVAEPAPEASAGPCAAVGLRGASVISPEARDLNRAALEHQRAGRLAEAEAGFRAAAEMSPDYRMARFNHACALSLLGRADEAWTEIQPLLCADLPSFAPRLRSDPDLAAVRDGRDVASALDAIGAQYRTLMPRGTPMTSYEHGPELGDGMVGRAWEESQAGVYVHSERLFLPMGPRHHMRGPRGGSGEGYALPATRFDAATGRVLSILAHGDASEGGAGIGAFEVQLHEAPLGDVVIEATRTIADAVIVDATVTGPSALRLRDGSFIPLADITTLDVTPGGFARVPSTERTPPYLSAGSLSWEYVGVRGTPAPQVEHTLADGRTVTLGPRRFGDRTVRTTRDPNILILVSEIHGDCGTRDHFVVERFDVSTATAVVLWEERDRYPIVEEGADGAIYIQAGDETRRYENLGAGGAAFDALSPGLGLTSGAFDFNPYC